ncbi:hypothetical protein D932_00011 [Enterococcus casseliflavus 14-MB-W-14]|uniref:glycosyltransferase domain-containing protein n=1 Tax=Enterococcus TaxID=1350 RepID=UPI00035369B4|nr:MULTISPECIES: glycosyltransferase domain-containing protein [Enterococcus]EPH66789.1 hypothetical protein D932_00011 [Enterococcus casseliflavus 14-MB-W-14]MBW9324175.1 DUF616 domain-containing protein [Enterococcus casseliflavus]MEB5951040.1 DUF616 domain-containing protein [Enterococcus innesii]
MDYKKTIEVLEKQNLEIIRLRRETRISDFFSKLSFDTKSFNYIMNVFIKKKISKTINRNFVVFRDEENRNNVEMIADRQYVDDKKIVVYTCITGNYDNIPELTFLDEDIDYYLFTDQEPETVTWKTKRIPDYITYLQDNVLINRYLKMHPFELFEDKYDIAIYIDGNVDITSDIKPWSQYVTDKTGLAFHRHFQRDCLYQEAEVLKLYKKGNATAIDEQIQRYKKVGFPINYGLPEATVIVSDLNNLNSKKVFNQWWEEFIKTGSFRDQLSLPYVLWKNNILVSEVTKLGKNLYRSAKISVKSH